MDQNLILDMLLSQAKIEIVERWRLSRQKENKSTHHCIAFMFHVCGVSKRGRPDGSQYYESFTMLVFTSVVKFKMLIYLPF